MDRTTITRSSTIRAIGYDPRRSVLQVEFKNGRAYHYNGIPRDIYSAFVNAESHGRFFNRFIKEKYPAKRVP